MDFTEDQILRYSRHILLPEVGGDGQEKILNAKVVLVGAGGLGCPVGYYLTAAGVGTIALIDNDHVEMSNLQRQIAHSVNTIGMPKVEDINHNTALLRHFKRLNEQAMNRIREQMSSSTAPMMRGAPRTWQAVPMQTCTVVSPRGSRLKAL